MLQSFLNHTVQRILLSFEYEEFLKCNTKLITLTRKWGIDGAGGQQTYKQNFSAATNSSCQQDSRVLIICYVPFQMTDENDDVLWSNNRASSTR